MVRKEDYRRGFKVDSSVPEAVAMTIEPTLPVLSFF
jgi:hypothetical protein